MSTRMVRKCECGCEMAIEVAPTALMCIRGCVIYLSKRDLNRTVGDYLILNNRTKHMNRYVVCAQCQKRKYIRLFEEPRI